jgi:nicotinamide-nucleotide amidase
MAGMMNASGSVVGNLLKERGQTLAIAESSAGGLINAALVAVPGASAWYLGGCIVNMWTFARRAIELLESCLRKTS